MLTTENKKETILKRIDTIIDIDIKADKCDQYTEYAIYLSDEIRRLDDIKQIDNIYEKVISKIDLPLNSIDLYEEFDTPL